MAEPTYQSRQDLPNGTSGQVIRIDPVDISGMLRTLWGGKWLIMLSIILAVFAAGYYAFAIAGPRYAATTTLHIAPTRDITQDPVTQGGGINGVNLNTEIAILTSQQVLRAVIKDLALHEDPAFNRYLIPVAPWSISTLRTRLRNALTGQSPQDPSPAARDAKLINNLRQSITVTTQRDAQILHITATTGAAETSTQIANTLAAVYLTDQVNAQFAATETTVNWLSERVYALQLELEGKETAITDLISTAQVPDEQALDAISRQATETDQRLREARTALSEFKISGQDPLISTVSASLNSETRRLTGQIAALEVFRTNLSHELATQSASLVRLQQLRREADATRLLYETFIARLQGVNLERGLQGPDSRVLNMADTGQHVAPRKMLILAIAAILGAAFGVAFTFLRQGLRRGFSNATSLAEATGLPVMALCPVTRPNPLIPTPAFDSAIRGLRTSLLLAGPDGPPQSILCTSSIAKEGHDTLATGLAQNLARLGKSVLLLGCDPQADISTRPLERGEQADFALILAGAVPLDAAITRDPRFTFHWLSSQSTTQDSADLFATASYTALINRLRERYDHIIIQAPPVLTTPDTRILAQHADAVVYAVRWNKTASDLVLAGKQTLADVHAPITGLVLSKLPRRNKARHLAPVYGHDLVIGRSALS